MLVILMLRDATSGFVLAGGRSSRMGLTKALLPWHGRTLIEHIAGQVRQAAGNVTTVGGEAVEGVVCLPDRHPGFGPVGGIATALASGSAPWNLIVACDMPGLTAVFLEGLIAAAFGHGNCQAVIPVTPDRRIHPLCAAYHRSAGTVINHAVALGRAKLTDVVAELRCIHIAVDTRLTRNVNTPAEWAAVAEVGQE